MGKLEKTIRDLKPRGIWTGTWKRLCNCAIDDKSPYNSA